MKAITFLVGAVVGIAFTAAFGALFALLNGWLLMTLVDVIHNHWTPEVPTIGYWWAVLVMWLAYCLFGTATAGSDQKASH